MRGIFGGKCLFREHTFIKGSESVRGRYTHENWMVVVHLKNAINNSTREGWHTVAQYGRISPLEEHPKPSPQV